MDWTAAAALELLAYCSSKMLSDTCSDEILVEQGANGI
jgi:hypothetical protein